MFVSSCLFANSFWENLFEGLFGKTSGQYKYFQYQDGNRHRNIRAEYAGLFLKAFCFEGEGAHRSLVCYGRVRLWNSNKWTDWEEISRGRAPYMTASELEEAITYVDSVIFTEVDGTNTILEMTPDNDGDYWWWTNGGELRFFQNIYTY